jgi:VanZ family protein
LKIGLRGFYDDWMARPGWQKAALLAAQLLLVGILSSTPGHGGSGAPQLRGFVLNWAHQPLYGAVAVLIAALLRVRLPSARWGPFALVVALTLAVGVADEVNQLRIPQRDSSMWDLGSDTLGAILALTVAGWTSRREGPLFAAGPALFCLGLSLAYNCLPAFLPNVPLPLPTP